MPLRTLIHRFGKMASGKKGQKQLPYRAPVVVIYLDSAYVDQAKIVALKDLLEKYPGPSEVRVRIEGPDTGIMEMILDETCGVSYTAEFSDAVEGLLGYPALQTREAEPN
jgi:hypothetical protein